MQTTKLNLSKMDISPRMTAGGKAPDPSPPLSPSLEKGAAHSEGTNVHVCVRVRPFNQREKDAKGPYAGKPVIRMSEKKVELLDLDKGKAQPFAFDDVFWSMETPDAQGHPAVVACRTALLQCFLPVDSIVNYARLPNPLKEKKEDENPKNPRYGMCLFVNYFLSREIERKAKQKQRK